MVCRFVVVFLKMQVSRRLSPPVAGPVGPAAAAAMILATGRSTRLIFRVAPKPEPPPKSPSRWKIAARLEWTPEMSPWMALKDAKPNAEVFLP